MIPRRLGTAVLVLLGACTPPLRTAQQEYARAWAFRDFYPSDAAWHFENAEASAEAALQEDGLDVHDRVLAVSIRARSLAALGRHVEIPPLVSPPIPGYVHDRAWEGDRFGLLLIKAHALGAERGFAELVAAELISPPGPEKLHLAWEQVLFLERMGTPKSRVEAARICDANRGKIDFDQRRKVLAP